MRDQLSRALDARARDLPVVNHRGSGHPARARVMHALRFGDVDWKRRLIVLRGETTKNRTTPVVPISMTCLKVHVFVEPEMPAGEGDRRVDVIDDVPYLNLCGTHVGSGAPFEERDGSRMRRFPVETADDLDQLASGIRLVLTV